MGEEHSRHAEYQNIPSIDECVYMRPKSEIADYVESAGFLVPKRFDTFDEAIHHVQHGGKVLIRSETPADYSGPSGLLHSYLLTQKTVSRGEYLRSDFPDISSLEDAVYNTPNLSSVRGIAKMGPGIPDLEDMIIGRALGVPAEQTLALLTTLNARHPYVREYIKLTGDNRFNEASISFSFWEYIPGSNLTITADDATPDRYHLFGTDDDASTFAGMVMSDGTPLRFINSYNQRMTPGVIQRVVANYEAIRNLPAFSPNNCPLLEMQLDEDNNLWFLQYQKGRDYAPATFRLDLTAYPPEKGWLKLDSVRGAIGELATSQIALYYPNDCASAIPQTENGNVDPSTQAVTLHAAFASSRLAYVMHGTFARTYRGMADGHLQRTQWFAPQTSGTYGNHQEETSNAIRLLHLAARRAVSKQQIGRVTMDIASDGRFGFVRPREVDL